MKKARVDEYGVQGTVGGARATVKPTDNRGRTVAAIVGPSVVLQFTTEPGCTTKKKTILIV